MPTTARPRGPGGAGAAGRRAAVDLLDHEGLTSAELIAKLVEVIQEMVADRDRGTRFNPPLSDKELALYDAVADNASALDVMGTDVLAAIARDLVATMRRTITVDWMSREPVRAKLRSTIRRVLAKHDYPPDRQQDAIDLVIRQMETFAEDWSPHAPR